MTQFDPRIPRDLAVQLGEEAVVIAQAGEYIGPAGLVGISTEVKACVQATVHYAAHDRLRSDQRDHPLRPSPTPRQRT